MMMKWRGRSLEGIEAEVRPNGSLAKYVGLAGDWLCTGVPENPVDFTHCHCGTGGLSAADCIYPLAVFALSELRQERGNRLLGTRLEPELPKVP